MCSSAPGVPSPALPASSARTRRFEGRAERQQVALEVRAVGLVLDREARVQVEPCATDRLRQQELRRHAQRVRAQALLVLRLRKRQHVARAQGGSAIAAVPEAQLRAQGDVAEVGGVPEVRVVAHRDTRDPLDVDLGLVGRRPHEAQRGPVEAVPRQAGQEVRLVPDRVLPDLERQASGGRRRRLLRLQRPRLRVRAAGHGERRQGERDRRVSSHRSPSAHRST
jgi:hypothetical protein